MSVLILTLVALGTLAFGAVYPWAYLPLFFAAATIGVTGIIRPTVNLKDLFHCSPSMRPISFAVVGRGPVYSRI